MYLQTVSSVSNLSHSVCDFLLGSCGDSVGCADNCCSRRIRCTVISSESFTNKLLHSLSFSLHAAWSTLQSIKSLDVSHNLLAGTLPAAWAGQWTHVQHISLTHNKVRAGRLNINMPHTFGALHSIAFYTVFRLVPSRCSISCL